jgi:ATP-dependent DNA ligase
VHEIKHDGYRPIVRRDGATVRLFTRRGYDWTDRYPAIATAAGKPRAKSFTMDGEAVVLGSMPYSVRSPAGAARHGSTLMRDEARGSTSEVEILKPTLTSYICASPT